MVYQSPYKNIEAFRYFHQNFLIKKDHKNIFRTLNLGKITFKLVGGSYNNNCKIQSCRCSNYTPEDNLSIFL